MLRSVLAGLVAGALVACGHGAPPERPVTGSAEDWAAARAVAERWAATTHGAPAASIESPNPRIPFLFEVTLPDTGAVLVHRGEVVTRTGLEPLGAYLDEAGVYAAGALTLDDVLELIHHFHALPPPGQYYYSGDDGPLRIGFAWRGEEIELTLSYLLDRGGDHGNDADEDDGPAQVAQWTLRLARGVTPRWTEARRDFDTEQQRFVP